MPLQPIRAGDLRGVIGGPAGAPIVVLLHGNGESHRDLAPVADELAGHYRVIALDSRAHGDSSRGVGPLTIDRMADDLRIALDDLDIQQAHLVGFSDGGNIALAFAAQHPHRVASLITYGANLNPNGVKVKLRWQSRAQLLFLRLGSVFSRRLRARAEIVALMTTQPHIDPASLSVSTAPALIAAGEHDVIRETHTSDIAAALPNSKLLIVPGATHGLPIKDPSRFAKIVEDFLE